MCQDGDLGDGREEKLWGWLATHVRWALANLVEALMEYERDSLISCQLHERGPGRRGYRNCCYPRSLDARFGPVLVRKPEVRGTDWPVPGAVTERYARRER